MSRSSKTVAADLRYALEYIEYLASGVSKASESDLATTIKYIRNEAKRAIAKADADSSR